jgi:hypothetical protein
VPPHASCVTVQAAAGGPRVLTAFGADGELGKASEPTNIPRGASEKLSNPARIGEKVGEARLTAGKIALGALELTAGLLFDEVPWYISVQDRDFKALSANRALTANFDAPV